MPSPTGALVWKEWRELRGVVLSGTALGAAMPFILVAGSSFTVRGVDLPAIAEALPLFITGLLWPLFGAACGASTIAGEIGEGTLPFLLSRPVTRARIWSVKVAAALGALLAIVASSLAVTWLFGLAAGGSGLPPFLDLLVPRGGDRGGPPGLSVTAAVFLLFSSSVFFSTFLPRALTAAAAGLVASLLVLSGILAAWSRMDLVPHLEPGLLAAEILLAGVLLLLGSRHVFSRGELLRGSALRGTVTATVLMVLAGGGLFGVPLAYSRLRLSTAEAVLTDPVVAPAGDVVVATAATPEGLSPQIWMVHTDGSGFERVTGRLTLASAFSPDGTWLAYLSFRGSLGLRSDRAELRAIHVKSGEDRLLAEGLPFVPHPLYEIPALIFSPDGSHVACVGRDHVVVVSLDGVTRATPSLGGTDLRHGWVLGWTADGRELILVSRKGVREEGAVVAALDPWKRRVRVLYAGAFSYGALFWQTGRPAGGFTHLPFVADEDSEARRRSRLVLLDVRDGSVREVSGSACPLGLDLSRDGSALAWIECDGTADATTVSQGHVLDLASMTDVRVGSFPGRPLRAHLSPSRDRMAIFRMGAGVPAILLDAEGGTQPLEAGWTPLGWSGRNRVVLEDERAGRLAVVDVASGALREIHPLTGSPL